MAHPAKRITRKHLREPDRFIILTGDVLEAVKKHRNSVLVACGVVLALLLAATGWTYYKERQNRLAARAYHEAVVLYADHRYRDALVALEKVTAYRSSAFARYASLYQANAHWALNDSPSAIGALEKFLQRERDPMLRQLALISLGNAHESRAQCKQAVPNYHEASELDGPLKEDGLLRKAACQVKDRDFPAAIQTYRAYLATYPSSIRAGAARLKLKELEQIAKSGAP